MKVRTEIVESRLYNEKFKTSFVARDFFYGSHEIKKVYEQNIPERQKQNIIQANVKLEK